MTDSNRVTRFSLQPMAGALGARIEGIDLAAPMSAALLEAVREAFRTHLVLAFPGQGHLTARQQAAFASNWGALQKLPAGTIDEGGLILELKTGGPDDPRGKNRDISEAQKLARPDIWHADQTFERCPPLGSFLLARTLPPVGGDTMFSNQHLAYEALSAPLRQMLDSLTAQHSGEGYYGAIGRNPADAPRNVHPVVTVHPETGRRSLFVNRIWTKRIVELDDAESRALLAFLHTHSERPEFTFRHHWQEGDLLMWDNRCTLHYAINDYGLNLRVMHRATAHGQVPAGCSAAAEGTI